jgi:N-acetyl-1-D-myo-inositol-2-amino-2-deoxy-alpha-D-glucopyranoside deacetylase
MLLNHADGDLRWIDAPQFDREIVEAIQRLQPDGVITFAEDGLYWHLDHIGIHERTWDAVESLGDSAPPLYFVTIPKGVMREVVGAAITRGTLPPDPRFWGIEPDAFGAAAPPASFVVDVRDWVPRKLTALRCHRTQMGSTNPFAWIDDTDARRLLGLEYFRRAPIPSRWHSGLELLGDPVAL